jgi:hypothetical protein
MVYRIERKRRFDRLFSFWMTDEDLEFLDHARPEEVTVAEYLWSLIGAEKERRVAEGWMPAFKRPEGGPLH